MSNETTLKNTPDRVLPGWLVGLIATLIAILFPVVLVLSSVRLVMTEAFLQIEYHRPNFPEDRFGFTQEDRLKYAPYAVHYLTNSAGIDYLGKLRLDGEPMFNERELKHMEDVKTVTSAALDVLAGLGILFIGGIAVLAWRPYTRQALRRSLLEGGILTIFVIITLVVLAVASWDTFFTDFHHLFFEGNSWQFSTSDTLIRLFPEQFWFDASLTIGGLAVLGALLAIGGAVLWERHVQHRLPPDTSSL